MHRHKFNKHLRTVHSTICSTFKWNQHFDKIESFFHWTSQTKTLIDSDREKLLLWESLMTPCVYVCLVNMHTQLIFRVLKTIMKMANSSYLYSKDICSLLKRLNCKVVTYYPFGISSLRIPYNLSIKFIYYGFSMCCPIPNKNSLKAMVK